MPKQKESDVVVSVLDALGRRPDLCRIWRQNTGCLRDCWGRPVRFGCVGAGDISGLLVDGRRLEIECKSATGKQRPEQESFQAMIERFGGVYLLVRSVEEAVREVEEEVQFARETNVSFAMKCRAKNGENWMNVTGLPCDKHGHCTGV